MSLDTETTALPGVVIVKPRRFGDARGFFVESWQREAYREVGIDCAFVQDNMSSSVHGVVRGLHYQLVQPQDKLVTVVQGRVLDVAVDIRRGSPHFGKAVAVELSDENGWQLFVPKGFAHGFCVLSETVIFHYKCSDRYCPAGERGVLWNDPALAIPWPSATATLSDKDQALPRLAAVSETDLPLFE